MYKVELIEGTDSKFDGGFDKKFSTGLYQEMTLTKYSALIIVKEIRIERR